MPPARKVECTKTLAEGGREPGLTSGVVPQISFYKHPKFLLTLAVTDMLIARPSLCGILEEGNHVISQQ